MYYYERFDGYDDLVQAVLVAQPVGCGGSMHSLYDLMDISNSDNTIFYSVDDTILCNWIRRINL